LRCEKQLIEVREATKKGAKSKRERCEKHLSNMLYYLVEELEKFECDELEARSFTKNNQARC
jgi:hypothetical protein